MKSPPIQGDLSCSPRPMLWPRRSPLEGVVGSLYEEYEQRGEQVAMAEAVRNAFADRANLMVEAGTGVGKIHGLSFAGGHHCPR